MLNRMFLQMNMINYKNVKFVLIFSLYYSLTRSDVYDKQLKVRVIKISCNFSTCNDRKNATETINFFNI